MVSIKYPIQRIVKSNINKIDIIEVVMKTLEQTYIKYDNISIVETLYRAY